MASRDLRELTEAVESVPGARVEWHVNAAGLEEIAQLVGAGDRIRILHPVCHREMITEIRWTSAEAEGV